MDNNSQWVTRGECDSTRAKCRVRMEKHQDDLIDAVSRLTSVSNDVKWIKYILMGLFTLFSSVVSGGALYILTIF